MANFDESIFANLDEELKNKLKNCKSKEEVKALLKEHDGEFSDEIVELIAGGYGHSFYCPDFSDVTCGWMDH